MKKAVIDTRNNRTLSEIVQGLAFKSGFRWSTGETNLSDSLRYIVVGKSGHWGATDALTHIGSLTTKPEGIPVFDAATQMDKVIAFFEAKPEPKLRPWKPEEVPVGALIRSIGYPLRRGIIAAYSETYDEIISPTFKTDHHKFGTLGVSRQTVLDGCEHSTDNGKTWSPCGIID
jgi:hypothetical protein